MSRADRLAAIESGLLSPWANTAPLITTTKALSDKEAEAFRADATAGAITLTLPSASTAKDAYVRRVDVTQNALVILAAGTDKLMMDTTAEAAGQTQTELLFAGDWLHLRSDGAGKWWCVGQAQLPGSIASGLVAYATAGSHTFNTPAVLRSGRRRARVTVTGGGAGGAASTTANERGGGGGGGGTAIRVVNLSGVASVSIAVGGGGARGVLGIGPEPGGTSSFGAYLSATGGAQGSANDTTGNGGGGGSAGNGAGGDINLRGGSGHDGNQNIGNAARIAGGIGGASYWGGPAQAGVLGTSADVGAQGAGGSGGNSTAGGSVGANGIVRVEW